MTFRVATLNMEQDHKRWDLRRELIVEQLGEIRPDVFCLNEVCIPRQTARWLQAEALARHGLNYALVQQSRPGALSGVDGEAILTRFPIVETANLDYRARDSVAQVARLDVEGRLVDIYVTHLYMSRGDDSLRLYQVQQLLEWISARDDVDARVVCGDFNATLDAPSAGLMARHFKPSQTEPTAFTPLADEDGEPSHPYWDRLDRCIDYIWVSGALKVRESMVCFNRPSPTDPTLWPSDHAGVWADIELI
ncbi:MAG: endonuclease/exonuclease/phosphatase family protein [Chloroflexi bacterium]|nr:endonuclease/exonuclease/phosphatase family protein [Chloroflexota bacterium]